MNKVLLINSPNRQSEPPRHYPYGIGIISSILRNNGYSVDYFDGNFQTTAELYSVVAESNYSFIGLSGLVTTYEYQKNAIKTIKKANPAAIVGSGGGLASSADIALLELVPELDVLFIGEAEKSVLSFMKNLTGSLDSVKGIAYRTDQGIKRNPNEEFIKTLDDIPYPDIDLLNLERYFENKSFPLSPNVQSASRRGNVLTSRGCPYHCDFCSNTLGRKVIRYRSTDNVIGEITELIGKYHIDFISFMDESFLTNKKLVYALSEELKKLNRNIRWGIAARSTSVDAEILKEIKSAGCDYIYYGFDSGSENTLLRMNKKMTLDDNFNAFKLSVEAGIYPVPNIIIGYDNETMMNIEDNYRFFQRLIQYGKTLQKSNEKEFFERGFNNFGAIYFATPYPGSELYNRNKDSLPSIDQILSKISFKDAYELTVNVSNIPNDILMREQKKMENFVRSFKL